VLSPELQAKPNILVVGDIHGCVDELRAMLSKVGFDPATWALIVVGDIVAKGPDSVACVELLMQLGAVGVRGNHEDNVLEAAEGVRETKEHVDLAKSLSPEQLRWLQDLPLTIRIPHVGEGLLVVHAGLLPGVPLEKQLFVDLLWMRDVLDGVGVKKPVPGSTGWAELWKGPEHAIFGHDAQRKVQLHEHATGLDSGCCYGNSLTAVVVRGDWSNREIVSVPAARMYSVPTNRGVKLGESPFPKALEETPKKDGLAATRATALETSEPEAEPQAANTPTKPQMSDWDSPVCTPKRSWTSVDLVLTPLQECHTNKRPCKVPAS